ncbi:Na+/H+ antiporter subunit G [Ramlibacter sp.]|uniref:Na+/H+ antiporter subunit G n=1 Tax=Ramlibacter sp. TaxID=1917967 RepID=UPI002D23BAC1|nr:Na+/H+ antiporter subunit G [Ramlibacter sp.]HYD74422.1 Na+/H+ antiporter subunit G [Ramlibacter sp.]
MSIVEAIVAVLLLASGLLTLTGALGLLRLRDYFLRMHAPSLAYTLGSWAVALASIVHFTASGSSLSLHVWLVIILLSITAPVTTVLLARAALFRERRAGADLPPVLGRRDPA